MTAAADAKAVAVASTTSFKLPRLRDQLAGRWCGWAVSPPFIDPPPHRLPLPAAYPHLAAGLQVGTPGEEQAAQYLLGEMQRVAALAAEHRPDLQAEAARESVRVLQLLLVVLK